MFGVRDFGMEQQRVEPRSRSSIAATGALALVAITAKPGGAGATRSPWLAQTRKLAGQRLNSGARPASLTCTSAWPNSRCGAGATSPPSASVISCMP